MGTRDVPKNYYSNSKVIMATCVKLKRKKTRVCIGSLNRRVTVLTRKIVTPQSGSVDYTESFTEPKTVWAMVNTVSGLEIFDETNQVQTVSHEVFIRYLIGITPEKWVKLLSVNSEPDFYVNILQVENYQENSFFYKLICNLRGKDSLPVNEA